MRVRITTSGLMRVGADELPQRVVMSGQVVRRCERVTVCYLDLWSFVLRPRGAHPAGETELVALGVDEDVVCVPLHHLGAQLD